MQTKTATFKEKIRNYSVLAGTALAAAGTANGQIVYHPLSPAIVLSNDTDKYQFDLNGDATNDFWFEIFKATNFSEAALRFDGSKNSVRATTRTYTGRLFAFPSASNPGNKIGPSGQWVSVNNLLNSTSKYFAPVLASRYNATTYGQWNSAVDKYVPLRIKTGTNFNYGWVRCSVTTGGNTLTISGYAYQTIPDSSILAGDTGSITGVNGHQLQNLDVYAFGKNVVVKYPGAPLSGMTITVYDLQGKEVRSVQTSAEMYTMNLDAVASGIYAVTVRSGKAETTQKVSIQ